MTDVLALLAPFLPTVEFDVAIRDVTDRPLVIAAVAGHADAIVTGDRDLLDDTALQAHLGAQGIRILSPRELLSLLPAVSEERGRYVTRRRRYRVAGPRTRMRRAAARAGLSR